MGKKEHDEAELQLSSFMHGVHNQLAFGYSYFYSETILNQVPMFLENPIAQQYFSFLYFPVILNCETHVRDLKRERMFQLKILKILKIKDHVKDFTLQFLSKQRNM